jgi:hypothetical protein
LVLKAQDTIQGSRIEWDAGWSDIAQAFLTIKRGTTGSGQVTYSASRTDATGHADIAWAIMHALSQRTPQHQQVAAQPLRHQRTRPSCLDVTENSQHRTQQTPKPMRSFTFGAPEAVLTENIGQYLGRICQPRRADVPTASVAHRPRQTAQAPTRITAPFQDSNATSCCVSSSPHRGFQLRLWSRSALDYMVFGETYLYRNRNAFGQVLELQHLPAINMRVKIGGGFIQLLQDGREVEFDEDEVEHIFNYDVEQNIYGVPDYLGGLQALLLNEAATLFRRRYYSNGAHVGYIFYSNDPNMSQEDEDNLQSQIATQGRGQLSVDVR